MNEDSCSGGTTPSSDEQGTTLSPGGDSGSGGTTPGSDDNPDGIE